MSSLDHSQLLNCMVRHRLKDDGPFRQALAYFVAANAQQSVEMHRLINFGHSLDQDGRDAVGYLEDRILESFRSVFGFDLKEAVRDEA